MYISFWGIIAMATASQFENRRRARERRMRRRRKRIRAVILLILFIILIILMIIGISKCSHRGENGQIDGDTTVLTDESSPEPTSTPSPAASVMDIPSAQEENNIMQILTDAAQEKRCYLTFDDGPTANITPQILDVLRRYNVKATFFEVGSLIETNPDVARRVYEEGHLIANHSNSHNYEKLYASTSSFMNEINSCYDIIKSVTDGEEPFKLIRFPGGSYDSDDDSYSTVKQECKTALANDGYYFCDWNSLTGDAEGKKKGAEELLSYLKQSLNTNRNAIVLMHDASSKQATVDALPSIIEYLASEGYTFHRLDDIDYRLNDTPVMTLSPESDDKTSSDTDLTDSNNSSDSDTDTDGDYNDDSENGFEIQTPAPTTRPTVPPSNSGTIVIQ